MKFVINGNKKLSGSVEVAGAKNAATPIIAATLLTNEECVLRNVPRITDVEKMLEILRSVGGKVEWTGDNELTIRNQDMEPQSLDRQLVKSLRSSILFMGSFLARFQSIDISEPGGCIIGNRPLDTHFQAMQKLGATIERTNGTYHISHHGLKGDKMVFLEASVTATENALMLASLTPGVTTIVNAATEPHVQDLTNFLVSMGAIISGIGTSTLTITGVESLHGATHSIIPDTIEAGSFMILGIATKSQITFN